MHLKTQTIGAATIAAILLLAVAGIAQAQSVKKYVTPDGRTIYSDVPVPGAREVGKIAPPQPVDPASLGDTTETVRKDTERARELEQRQNARSMQEERIQAAEKLLENARQALANGKEPLPGERIGIAGGGTRLTEAYLQRQQANEIAVEQAERQLEALRAGR